MKIHLFDKDQNTEQFPAQQTVFQLGDTGDCMFAVVAGAVDIVINDKVVETVEAGGVFGEMALVDDQPRAATAIVRIEAKVVRIDRRRFMFLVQQNPFFALQLMTVMAQRLRQNNGRIVAGASA
jgi:CRP-like cAMP-binding protein